MIIQANSRQKKGVQKLSEGNERFFAPFRTNFMLMPICELTNATPKKGDPKCSKDSI